MRCPKCGGENEDGAKFCAYCGQPMKSGIAGAADDFSDKVGQVVNEFENPPEYTGEFDPADIQKNKTISLFSYIGILLIIPWMARPNSKFARFHVNQGIVLLLANIVVNIIERIIRGLFDSTVLIGPFNIVFWIVEVFFFVVMIIGIINAVNGRAKELPFIGKIRFLKY